MNHNHPQSHHSHHYHYHHLHHHHHHQNSPIFVQLTVNSIIGMLFKSPTTTTTTTINNFPTTALVFLFTKTTMKDLGNNPIAKKLEILPQLPHTLGPYIHTLLLGGKFYFLGGLKPPPSPWAMAFDPSLNQWASLPNPAPTPPFPITIRSIFSVALHVPKPCIVGLAYIRSNGADFSRRDTYVSVSTGAGMMSKNSTPSGVGAGAGMGFIREGGGGGGGGR
ncbi:hypothetical protein CsSME_00012889 [Camellia sinensis var. sinensis]